MRPALLLAALAAVAILGGCGKGNFSARTNEGKANVLRYPIVTITTLDPHRVEDGDTLDIIQQVFEGLVTWGEDNKVRPNLAEKWEVSPDGKTYTFTLKKDVKFHNGEPVTAEDFKYSFDRACDPALKSATVTSYLNDIVGVMDVVNGKAESVAGVKVVDPQTLTITLVAPRPYFLGKLTFATSYVVSKKATKRGDLIDSVQEMVGTGPFRAERFAPEQLMVLAANQEYRDGAPKIAKIERPTIGDPATQLNKYRSGELDIIPLARQNVAGIQADAKFKDHLQFFDRPALWYIGMNGGAYKPFADRRVRRAFAMAIDRESIVREKLGGVNTIANGILPPGVLGYRTDVKAIPYDPEAARALLAEAGYKDGKGLPRITMTFREGMPDIRIVAETVASDLKRNLGVEIGTQPMQWVAYLDKHNRKEQAFFHMRWGADYLDPENFLSLLLASYGAQNKVNYKNDAYDALTRQADSTLDEATRLKLYAQAEDMVVQDAPFIPIYFQKDAELINPRVKGIRNSLFGHLPHTTTSLE